jgi:hypothetical protein
MTNKIRKHYLKHKFQKSDSITISYVTGSELSKREDESIFSSSVNLSSGQNFKSINLGNITANSEIDISIFPKTLAGVRLSSVKKNFTFAPRCRGRGNCSGTNWGLSADFEVNKFKSFKEKYEFNNIAGFIKNTQVFINNQALDLNKLIESNQAIVEINDDHHQYVKIKIKNTGDLDGMVVGSENYVSLKINSLRTGKAGEGIRLTKLDGKNIKKSVHAANVAIQEAFKHNTKISPDTLYLSEWKRHIEWGKIVDTPQGKRKLEIGKYKKYFESQVVDIVATVTNFIN